MEEEATAPVVSTICSSAFKPYTPPDLPCPGPQPNVGDKPEYLQPPKCRIVKKKKKCGECDDACPKSNHSCCRVSCRCADAQSDRRGKCPTGLWACVKNWMSDAFSDGTNKQTRRSKSFICTRSPMLTPGYPTRRCLSTSHVCFIDDAERDWMFRSIRDRSAGGSKMKGMRYDNSVYEEEEEEVDEEEEGNDVEESLYEGESSAADDLSYVNTTQVQHKPKSIEPMELNTYSECQLKPISIKHDGSGTLKVDSIKLSNKDSPMASSKEILAYLKKKGVRGRPNRSEIARAICNTCPTLAPPYDPIRTTPGRRTFSSEPHKIAQVCSIQKLNYSSFAGLESGRYEELVKPKSTDNSNVCVDHHSTTLDLVFLPKSIALQSPTTTIHMRDWSKLPECQPPCDPKLKREKPKKKKKKCKNTCNTCEEAKRTCRDVCHKKKINGSRTKSDTEKNYKN